MTLGSLLNQFQGTQIVSKRVDNVDRDLGNYVASRSTPQSLRYLDLDLDLNNKIFRYKISLIFPGLDLDLEFDSSGHPLPCGGSGCLDFYHAACLAIDHAQMLINLLWGEG